MAIAGARVGASAASHSLLTLDGRRREKFKSVENQKKKVLSRRCKPSHSLHLGEILVSQELASHARVFILIG